MALIICSECGNEIYDQAAACPKCGNPIHPAGNQEANTKMEKPIAAKEGATWETEKLAIGIISMFLFLIVGVQSCATVFSDALSGGSSDSGTMGFGLAIFLVVAGIVGVITRESKSNAGSIVTAVLYWIGSLLTLGTGATFGDLPVWGAISFVFGLIFLASVLISLPAFSTGRNRTLFKAGLAVMAFAVLIAGSSGSGSGTTASDFTASNNSDSSSGSLYSISTPAPKKDIPRFKINETALITTSEGTYKITFTGVEETSDRNRFSDKRADRVILVSYDYENIDYQDSLYLNSWHFRVFDKSSTSLETYPASTKSGERLSPGRKTSASNAYALNNEDNYIEIEFYGNMFNDNSDCIFQLEW